MSFPGSIGTDLKLVLSLTLWILLNYCTFFDNVCEWMNSWRLKVILMIMAMRSQRQKEKASSAGTSASSPQPTSFLTDWLWSEFLFMVKGWKLLCVCSSAAATDLWTWHAW